MRTYIYAYMYAFLRVHTCIDIFFNHLAYHSGLRIICVYGPVYVYMYVCTYVCVCIYMCYKCVYMGKTKNWGNFVASKMAVR